MWRLAKITGLAAWCLCLGAFNPEHWFDKAKSPRISNYHIEATLDWPGKALEGRETISWRNTGTASTGEVPLHLYLNAFKGPQSIFCKENGGKPARTGFDETNPRHWGYCRLVSVQVDGRALDGHFGEDETVYWVRLPRPVEPGETIRQPAILMIRWQGTDAIRGHNILRHVVQDYVPWFNLFNCFSEGEVVRILAAAHNRGSSFDIPLSSLIAPPNIHVLDINGSDFRCQIPEEVPSGLISR